MSGNHLLLYLIITFRLYILFGMGWKLANRLARVMDNLCRGIHENRQIHPTTVPGRIIPHQLQFHRLNGGNIEYVELHGCLPEIGEIECQGGRGK